ncbi:hypothetical protein LJ707_07025 [Mucilaginibacter sp. UR6-1]|uniref:hypothetical protein n=1 Tax=Mucilaginibacter sp. UR6-1 TaxID=1435643 RepID=UPI001E30FE29|nr:hypothetical protein [Mucilaginibacter sp. UR6-1]MCC8408675.1 hypothetical protein [Mucilaginibacter sp. UR6-1]
MRKTSGIILIVLSCLIVVFAIADQLSFQKYSSASGTGEKLGIALDINGLLLFGVLLVLAVFMFIRGRRLLLQANNA